MREHLHDSSGFNLQWGGHRKYNGRSWLKYAMIMNLDRGDAFATFASN